MIDTKNLFRINKIEKAIFDNIETNIKKEDLYKYIPTVAEFDMENIVSAQLPGTSEKCNGLWFFLYNKNQTKNVVDELKFK